LSSNLKVEQLTFPNGSIQNSAAPKFYTDAFIYYDELDNGRITAGDYLYNYNDGTLFVTSFIPFNGWVTSKGSGYRAELEYDIIDDVPLIGGSGSGAEVSVFVLFGEIFEVLLTNLGSGYAIGDSLTLDLNDSGSGFEVILNSVNIDTGVIDNGYLQLFDITVY
jgi:hypothetical protein